MLICRGSVQVQLQLSAYCGIIAVAEDIKQLRMRGGWLDLQVCSHKPSRPELMKILRIMSLTSRQSEYITDVTKVQETAMEIFLDRLQCLMVAKEESVDHTTLVFLLWRTNFLSRTIQNLLFQSGLKWSDKLAADCTVVYRCYSGKCKSVHFSIFVSL